MSETERSDRQKPLRNNLTLNMSTPVHNGLTPTLQSIELGATIYNDKLPAKDNNQVIDIDPSEQAWADVYAAAQELEAQESLLWSWYEYIFCCGRRRLKYNQDNNTTTADLDIEEGVNPEHNATTNTTTSNTSDYPNLVPVAALSNRHVKEERPHIYSNTLYTTTPSQKNSPVRLLLLSPVRGCAKNETASPLKSSKWLRTPTRHHKDDEGLLIGDGGVIIGVGSVYRNSNGDVIGYKTKDTPVTSAHATQQNHSTTLQTPQMSNLSNNNSLNDAALSGHVNRLSRDNDSDDDGHRGVLGVSSIAQRIQDNGALSDEEEIQDRDYIIYSDNEDIDFNNCVANGRTVLHDENSYSAFDSRHLFNVHYGSGEDNSDVDGNIPITASTATDIMLADMQDRAYKPRLDIDIEPQVVSPPGGRDTGLGIPEEILMRSVFGEEKKDANLCDEEFTPVVTSVTAEDPLVFDRLNSPITTTTTNTNTTNQNTIITSVVQKKEKQSPQTDHIKVFDITKIGSPFMSPQKGKESRLKSPIVIENFVSNLPVPVNNANVRPSKKQTKNKKKR